MSLYRSEKTRFQIKGIGLKFEELRNLERVEAEQVGHEDRVKGGCSLLNLFYQLESYFVKKCKTLVKE
ncbi:MAG: hypothetical protein DSZ30_03990 [Aquificaceae bacterium]|nr:MAG: hypothetical protein DSZ30_03990 [Aquificaceae bacterium]